MSLHEAKSLQSQILFGSSECSCSSCESISCFAKRNRRLDACNCPACQELNSCLYIKKREDATCYGHLNVPTTEHPPNVATKESPICKLKFPQTRAKIDSKNIVSIRVFKRNVIVQAKPQCCDKPLSDKPIKTKCKSYTAINENNVGEYSPVSYIVNKVLTTYNDMSLRDIIEKIKRIYKACSCKVCDCMANDTSVCKCKPCECTECKSYLKDINEEKSSNVCSYFPVDSEVKETFSGYNRSSANDSLKLSSSACSCKPCDCELCRLFTFKVNENVQSFGIKYGVDESSYQTKSNHTIGNRRAEACSCKPCQCVACTSPFYAPNKVVVGSVAENVQSTHCSCVPCDCADCRSAVPSTSPHPVQETSTEMAATTACRCDLCFSHSCRQTRDTCGCESRNSVINKPFEKDTKDIDIHRALISKIKSKSDDIDQACTISILTKIIKDYKEKEAMRAKKSKSEDINKCLKCNSKMRCSSALCAKSHLSTHHLKQSEVTKCKCSPCECKTCQKLKSVENIVWKSVKFRPKCYCDMCRCIYCGGLLHSQSAPDDSQHHPETSQCEKKPGSSSTFPSHQSMYPALLYEYIIPRPLNENVPMNNSNGFCSDNLFKYTCDDCIRMVDGNKNEVGMDYSELSDSFCSCHVVNSCQDPSHHLRSDESLNSFHSKHSLTENRDVDNFVNEIMQIDGKSNVQYDNDKELSNSFDSTSWSFQEVIQTNSQLSLSNNMSGAKQTVVQEQEKKPNESCLFCGTFTLNSFSTNTDNKDGMQIIRECFAKTNLAVINNLDVNKKVHESNIIDESDTEKLKENSHVSKEGKIDDFEYYEDYLEERNILFKAKLLTSELLKMLYEFQKANKDYDVLKNKSYIDQDLEGNRNNLHLGKLPRQDLLQVLSMESKWNTNADTKLTENTTNFATSQEDNVQYRKFKYSWSKTALIKKRNTKMFPCHSKTDLTNNFYSNLKEELNYSEPIHTDNRTELGINKINDNHFAGNMNYLTRAEELPKFKQSSILENGSSVNSNMQEGNRNSNISEYLNFDSINYRDVLNANKNKICDDNRHILIENILQNIKQDEAHTK